VFWTGIRWGKVLTFQATGIQKVSIIPSGGKSTKLDPIKTASFKAKS
jgi:hypothetical protein